MFVLWLTGCKVIYQCALLFVSAFTKWQKTKKEDDPLSVFTVTSSSLPLYNHSSHGADYSQDHLTLHIMHWSFPLTLSSIRWVNSGDDSHELPTLIMLCWTWLYHVCRSSRWCSQQSFNWLPSGLSSFPSISSSCWKRKYVLLDSWDKLAHIRNFFTPNFTKSLLGSHLNKKTFLLLTDPKSNQSHL